MFVRNDGALIAVKKLYVCLSAARDSSPMFTAFNLTAEVFLNCVSVEFMRKFYTIGLL
jgi:hypothetical protein